jgi:hypothetical protein
LVAHLLRADAGVSEREEQDNRLLHAKIGAELNVDEAVGGLGLEGEIRGF